MWSYNPAEASPQLRFGLFPGRSPLLGESLLFSSPAGTKMSDGLSHSEIRASQDMCSYTRLIAAYHVLHRLREPRHPSCALSYFLSLCPGIRMQYISLYMHRKRRGCILSASSFVCLQVCQYVKYRPENLSVFTKRWRITDSNR